MIENYRKEKTRNNLAAWFQNTFTAGTNRFIQPLLITTVGYIAAAPQRGASRRRTGLSISDLFQHHCGNAINPPAAYPFRRTAGAASR
jgi:hypothetical protein